MNLDELKEKRSSLLTLSFRLSLRLCNEVDIVFYSNLQSDVRKKYNKHLSAISKKINNLDFLICSMGK